MSSDTIRVVGYLDSSFLRFFAASLALHFLLFLLWPKSAIDTAANISIPVALLPIPEKVPERPPQPSVPSPSEKNRTDIRVPQQAPTRISKVPAIIGKKNSPTVEEKPAPSREKPPAEEEPKRQETAVPQEFQEKSLLAERPLPSVKDLLPSATWSSPEPRNHPSSKPIPLNTREPVYITYFGSIQRSIDAHWQYPELALQYGLQGRVVIEFTILSNGRIESLRLVRSSGSILLDEEALRAIRAAAPFPPIPQWIEPKPLLISAGMEYHDGRLNARLAR
jgi:protein TonB